MNDKKTEYDWSGKTILVADDVYTNYILIEAILKNTKVNLIWAKDGQEAVDNCMNNQKIDLVLMDIQMPELNGIEATKIIKQIRTDLPVIAQTAFTLEYEEDTIINAGCAKVITKPLMPELIIKAISNYFDVKQKCC